MNKVLPLISLFIISMISIFYWTLISKNELYDAKNDTSIKLFKSIDFIITSDEDGFYYTNDLYNIFVFGETQNEVEDCLYDELKFQYDSYATENDDNLDSNAKKLKYNLLSLFDGNA